MRFITLIYMLKNFKHRGLKELFKNGRTSRVRADLQKRALRRLDALDAATCPEDMNIPGFDFHSLQGKPKRYSVHVNGPICITFGWENDGAVAIDVNLENYH